MGLEKLGVNPAICDYAYPWASPVRIHHDDFHVRLNATIWASALHMFGHVWRVLLGTQLKSVSKPFDSEAVALESFEMLSTWYHRCQISCHSVYVCWISSCWDLWDVMCCVFCFFFCMYQYVSAIVSLRLFGRRTRLRNPLSTCAGARGDV